MLYVLFACVRQALRIRELEKQLVLLVRELRSLNELDPVAGDAELPSPFNKSSLGKY